MKTLYRRRVDKNRGAEALRLLADRGFTLSYMPFIVGITGNRVKLLFTRFLVAKYSDEYELSITSSAGVVAHSFTGKQSRFTIEYRVEGEQLTARGGYQGPRKWLVSGKLRDIAKSLVEAALREAEKTGEERGRVGGAEDFSENLKSLSWTSKLIMKSMLLRNEATIITKGGLVDYIERLIGEGIVKKYCVVYVSGSSENGSFRLLFVNGELKGVYAIVDGKEYIGDDKALNMLQGVTRVKVYGSLLGCKDFAQQFNP